MNKEKIKSILSCNTTKIILIILLGIITLFVIKSKINHKYIRTIDENSPIIIYEDGKYGYVNTKGKVLIKPTYKQASRFYGKYAVVQDDEVYKIIDKKGTVKFENDNYSKLKYIQDYNVWLIEDKLYNSNLKQISGKNIIVSYEKNGIFKWKTSDNKQSGLMNYKGKKIFTYKFKDNEKSLNILSINSDNSSSESKKYCLINIDNNKYSILDCDNGKQIYKLTDNKINNISDTIYEVKDKDNKKFIERLLIIKGKIVYKTDESDYNIIKHNTYFTVKDKDDNKYVLRKTGKIVDSEPTSDDNISAVEQYLGYTKFSCDNGFGVKKNDKVKVKCEYDRIKFFDIVTTRYLKSKGKEYVLARKDKVYYLINIKNGKVKEKFNTDNISTYSVSMFITYRDLDTNEKYVYNLKTGKSIKVDTNASVTLYENYFTLEGDKIDYYNNNLKLVYTTKK